MLGTVARHLAAAASPAATKPARIGVIGTGWWATSRMMPDLVSIPGCELWAVVEPDSARRAEVAARFEIEHAFPDVSSLLSSAAAILFGSVVTIPLSSVRDAATPLFFLIALQTLVAMAGRSLLAVGPARALLRRCLLWSTSICL